MRSIESHQASSESCGATQPRHFNCACVTATATKWKRNAQLEGTAMVSVFLNGAQKMRTHDEDEGENGRKPMHS